MTKETDLKNRSNSAGVTVTAGAQTSATTTPAGFVKDTGVFTARHQAQSPSP